MKPIIEVAVNGAPNIQCPSMMPISVSGTGVRITSGSLNEPNCADHDEVDAEDGDAEGRAHVAEGDIGHFPLAVPEQRRLGFVVGLAMQRDLGLLAGPPVRLVDGVANRQHAVDRRLVSCPQVRPSPFRRARPLWRKIGNEARSFFRLTTSPSSTMERLPGMAFAGTGVDSVCCESDSSFFGKAMAISTG